MPENPPHPPEDLPTGTSGPPPTGSSGPPPTGSSGPPPTGSSGPPPTGSSGPPPTGSSGPPPTGTSGGRPPIWVEVGDWGLVATTLVQMSDGSLRPIETVETGHYVMAIPAGASEATSLRVEDRRVRAHTPTVALTFEGGDVVHATEEHGFVTDDGNVVPASHLRPGSRLKTQAGTLTVSQVESRIPRFFELVLEQEAALLVGNSSVAVAASSGASS